MVTLGEQKGMFKTAGGNINRRKGKAAVKRAQIPLFAGYLAKERHRI